MDSAVFLQASSYLGHSVRLVCKIKILLLQRFFMFSGSAFSDATGSMC